MYPHTGLYCAPAIRLLADLRRVLNVSNNNKEALV